MYQHRNNLKILVLTLTTTLLLIGCGETSDTQQPSEQSSRISTYITKGNFVDVASFAYKKADDPSFTQYAMDVTLPGTDEDEITTPSAYNVQIVKKGSAIKKIRIENYQNSVEVKMVDNNRVNVLFQDSNFTVDKQMSLSAFQALR